MDPRKSQKRATPKPLPPAQISSIEIPQSTQDGILKMLIRTFNHGQLRQPRPIPTKPIKTPLKTQTLNQKVHRPMTRAPSLTKIQKPTNPSSLKRSVSKIPPHQPEPKPDNTRIGINTLRAIQHAKHRTSMCQSQLARPTSSNKSSPQLEKTTLREMRGFNTMQSSRNIHGTKNTKLTTVTKR